MAPADLRDPRFLGVFGIIHHDVHGDALHDPARRFAAAHGKDHIDDDGDDSNNNKKPIAGGYVPTCSVRP